MSYPSLNPYLFLGGMIAYTALMVWFIIQLLQGFRRKELAQQRKLLENRHQAEKTLYETQQEIQEATFLQISRELHDNVGQTFALAKLGLANLRLDDPKEAEAVLSETTDILAKGIADLREISSSINGDQVRTKGLRKAVENQLAFLERTGSYHIHFTCTGSFVAPDARLDIIYYRILQESLNNIIRHAVANEITIHLTLLEEIMQLIVRDNGIGFCVNVDEKNGHRQGGLSNMKIRAKSVGADFQVDSTPGTGTTITLTTNFSV